MLVGASVCRAPRADPVTPEYSADQLACVRGNRAPGLLDERAASPEPSGVARRSARCFHFGSRAMVAVDMCPARAVDFPVGDSDWGAGGPLERAGFGNHCQDWDGGRCKNVDTGCGRALRHDVSACGSSAMIDALRLAFFRVDVRPLWLSGRLLSIPRRTSREQHHSRARSYRPLEAAGRAKKFGRSDAPCSSHSFDSDAYVHNNKPSLPAGRFSV